MATEGAKSAVSEPIVIITNHGVIDKLTLPAGSVEMRLTANARQHNNLEYKMSSGHLRICYEETGSPLYSELAESLKKLFDEKLADGQHFRQLDFSIDENGVEANLGDLDAYSAICQCFVFGGRLVAGGACLDEERSTWEIHTVGDGAASRNVVVGNLHFHGGDGKPEKRQAVLVVPVPAGDGGCGYIWLEGHEEELSANREEFLHDVVGAGQFSELKPQDEA